MAECGGSRRSQRLRNHHQNALGEHRPCPEGEPLLMQKVFRQLLSQTGRVSPPMKVGFVCIFVVVVVVVVVVIIAALFPHVVHSFLLLCLICTNVDK